MGKRTLIHHLLPVHMLDHYADLDEENVVTVRFGSRVTSEADLCDTFGTLIDGGGIDSLSTLAGQLHNEGRKRIVFIEDGHNLFVRSGEGLERMKRFLQFVSNTSSRVLWIVMLGEPAATFLETTLDLSDYFTHDFEVDPLDKDQIEQMIMTRHRVSGFHLDFTPPESRLFDKLRHPIAASEASRHPRRAFFDRLGRLSRGNPMLALLYWLESVRPDPEDDTLFRVDPLPKSEIDLLPALSVEQRLLVACIVRHRTVSLGELAEIFRRSPGDLRIEVEHLMRLGFVEVIPGRENTYRMRPMAEGLVTPELRSENLV